MPTGARSTTGLTIAATVLGAWAIALVCLLRCSLVGTAVLLAPLGVLTMTFLYTGLFITAHDAMHGTVAPGRPALNHAVGVVAAFAFALFDFGRLSGEHRAHHRAPASTSDPDYHAEGEGEFFGWYTRFIVHYIRPLQVLGLAAIFNVLHHGLGVPQANLFAFWFAPAVLAATQLFYFGTYLPHREPDDGYRDELRAESVRLPVLLSLLTCFHFGGFHHEHHAAPHVPWWKLPGVRVRRPAPP